MDALLIVAILVVVIVVVVALALNPIVKKQNDKAIAACREALGGRDAVDVLEPQAVGFASEPEEAGGLRGQGCLGANDSQIVFVSTARQKDFRIDRSRISKVDTPGDPRAKSKSTVVVTFTDDAGREATASWRVPDVRPWLVHLGYDWGPEGPPDLWADDADADD